MGAVVSHLKRLLTMVAESGILVVSRLAKPMTLSEGSRLVLIQG